MSQIDLDAYLNTHRQLSEAIQGLTKEELSWKANPQSWSVTEVLSHLADHNLVVSFRIRDILAGTSAKLPAFNQDAWVSGQRANEGAAADVLEAFGQLLRYNSLLFRRLSSDDYGKSGINAKGDTVTLTDIVNGFIRHVNHHIGQIERIKQAASAV
ncbi:DinB family protein [Paenibacillus aestuarii]|uniref:DinB family protein n=1 Tax=Paenibacillus aestuarii TaxID=516965 RepID=A0ABW0K7E7_9BACL|nr:DinB family protein [Paenibacillus aestuarii]